MADTNQERAMSDKTARYLKLIVLLAIVVALNMGGAWLSHQIDFQLFPRHEPILHTIVLVAVVLYVLLMATPFMPGIEIAKQFDGRCLLRLRRGHDSSALRATSLAASF